MHAARSRTVRNKFPAPYRSADPARVAVTQVRRGLAAREVRHHRDIFVALSRPHQTKNSARIATGASHGERSVAARTARTVLRTTLEILETMTSNMLGSFTQTAGVTVFAIVADGTRETLRL